MLIIFWGLGLDFGFRFFFFDEVIGACDVVFEGDGGIVGVFVFAVDAVREDNVGGSVGSVVVGGAGDIGTTVLLLARLKAIEDDILVCKRSDCFGTVVD